MGIHSAITSRNAKQLRHTYFVNPWGILDLTMGIRSAIKSLYHVPSANQASSKYCVALQGLFYIRQGAVDKPTLFVHVAAEQKNTGLCKNTITWWIQGLLLDVLTSKNVAILLVKLLRALHTLWTTDPILVPPGPYSSIRYLHWWPLLPQCLMQ